MNNQQKQQVLEQVKAANNVLVAVTSNPTVDELAASVGLTLVLNKLDKHATTVFSGVVPSTIEFLQPEKTIETTTDSLRDFIIALDKSKADKLRYKVEDDVVRIFITPYHTSISEKDLEYSQGDFNVDVVLALGVTRKDDLDKAITAHGRILHDATVISLTAGENVSDLGSINWQEQQASSLCEMVAALVTELQPDILDGQVATALLTGIIAETDRFKNNKTTPLALSFSSQLMSAGANQQLIAEKLDEPAPPPQIHADVEQDEQATGYANEDGVLAIEHDKDEIDKIHIDDNGNLGVSEHELEYEESASTLPPVQDDNNDDNQEVTDIPVDESNSDDQQNQGSNQSQYIQEDVGRELFDDLVSQKAGDDGFGEKPTLTQPDSTATPMMEHQKVITPSQHEDDIPKTDKPFDLQEAMSEASPTLPVQQDSESQGVDDSQAVSPMLPAPVPLETPILETPLQTPVPEPIVEVPEQLAAPASDTLADLEAAVGSPHAELGADEVSGDSTNLSSVSAEEPAVAHPDILESPKIESSTVTASNNPSDPPPVPPPMTPQFYDADGNNANPFLNPGQ